MDMRHKVIIVAVVAVAVLAAALLGMAIGDEDRSTPLNSDLTVEQNGELVYMDRFGVPDRFTIGFDPGAERTGWTGDMLVIALDPEDGPVTIGYRASFSWTDASRYLVEVCSDQESGWDVVVRSGGTDVTDGVNGCWIRTGGSEGSISYSVGITVDSCDAGISVRSVLEPGLGDLTGHDFDYRIVGQDADGLITGSMVLEVEYAGDGMYDLIPTWTVSYPDGTVEYGFTTLSFRDAFWTDGEYAGEKGLFTYWGEVPAEVYRMDDTELYVYEGILYEAVHECGDDLVIVQLTGSGYLGEGTMEPHLFSYVMEAKGFTRHGGEEVDVTGTIEVERHDATGTHVLDSTRYDLVEGGEPLDDPLIISWDPIDADDAEFSGLETVWTSAWGTVDTVRYSSDQGGRFLWWLYDDFITVEMVSLYTEDDGSLLFIEAETVSIVLDGDEVTDIRQISGLADEW